MGAPSAFGSENPGVGDRASGTAPEAAAVIDPNRNRTARSTGGTVTAEGGRYAGPSWTPGPACPEWEWSVAGNSRE
jgi:hypothetical protein